MAEDLSCTVARLEERHDCLRREVERLEGAINDRYVTLREFETHVKIIPPDVAMKSDLRNVYALLMVVFAAVIGAYIKGQ